MHLTQTWMPTLFTPPPPRVLHFTIKVLVSFTFYFIFIFYFGRFYLLSPHELQKCIWLLYHS